MKTLIKNKKCMVLSALTAAILNVSASHAATYEAFVIPTTDVGLNSSATAIGEDGSVSVTVTGVASNTTQNFAPANIPIDLTLVDFEDPALTFFLSDIEEVMNGNISDEDYIVLASYVLDNNPTTNTSILLSERQRVGRFESYLGDQNGATALPIFDIFDSDIGGLTRSINSVVNRVVDQDIYLGESSAPFMKLDFTQEDGDEVRVVFRDFAERGFVALGDQIVELPPEDTGDGGWSRANDINSNLLVAGTMSVSAVTGVQTIIDSCNDDELRGDIPIELCLSSIGENLANDSLTPSNFRDGFPGVFDSNEEQLAYNIEGVLWQLDSSGSIVSTTPLGFLTVPPEDSLLRPFSRAMAINEQGVAVGQSLDFAEGDENRPSSFAAVFIDGEVIGITDVNEFDTSSAVDINNNNIVAGQATMVISGRNVSKLFTYDVDTQETIFPEDFFSSSDVNVSAINDTGMVVGDAESDFTTTQLRSRSGFLFNPADNSFLNINDLLECDSPFTIISASDINENGEIAATALMSRPTRDSITLEVNLAEGDQDVLVALRLVPIPGGVIDDCSDIDNANNPSAERNGAAFGGGILILTLFGIFRRRLRR
jgi:hypothetical protein